MTFFGLAMPIQPGAQAATAPPLQLPESTPAPPATPDRAHAGMNSGRQHWRQRGGDCSAAAPTRSRRQAKARKDDLPPQAARQRLRRRVHAPGGLPSAGCRLPPAAGVIAQHGVNQQPRCAAAGHGGAPSISPPAPSTAPPPKRCILLPAPCQRAAKWRMAWRWRLRAHTRRRAAGLRRGHAVVSPPAGQHLSAARLVAGSAAWPSGSSGSAAGTEQTGHSSSLVGIAVGAERCMVRSGLHLQQRWRWICARLT